MRREKRIEMLAQDIEEILVCLPRLQPRLARDVESQAVAFLQRLRKRFDIYGGHESTLIESVRALRRHSH